jgi:hypothetical protein
VSAQLVSTDDNTEAWSADFAGMADEAYAVQDSITRAVGGTLQQRLGIASASRGVPTTASIRTTNAQAYDLYLRGKLFDGEVRVPLAIEKFEQAIAMDSNPRPAQLAVALELLPITTTPPRRPRSCHSRCRRAGARQQQRTRWAPLPEPAGRDARCAPGDRRPNDAALVRTAARCITWRIGTESGVRARAEVRSVFCRRVGVGGAPAVHHRAESAGGR